jgi:hypothetical protein
VGLEQSIVRGNPNSVVGHGGVREVQSPEPIAMIRRQPRECRVAERLIEAIGGFAFRPRKVQSKMTG